MDGQTPHQAVGGTPLGINSTSKLSEAHRKDTSPPLIPPLALALNRLFPYNSKALPYSSPQDNSIRQPPDARDEWFRSWFNELYLEVYSHRDAEEASAFAARWGIWAHLKFGDRCLDLGCGAGRYSQVLAARGLKVLAVDLSPVLLRQARAETPASKLTGAHQISASKLTGAHEECRPQAQGSVWLVRADMRRLPARGRFRLAVSLFTSFGYFQDEAEDRRLIADVSELLKPGGFLVLDLPNRDFVVHQVGAEPVTTRTVGQMQVNEARTFDSGISRVVKQITITRDGETAQFRESVRLYRPDQLRAMTQAAGLEPFGSLWGDYEGGDLRPDSPRMVYFGRKVG